VAAVAEVQKRTVVFVHCPSAVLMPWADSVGAIAVGFLPGQELGNAVDVSDADDERRQSATRTDRASRPPNCQAVLFGDANPSGRLPISFPNNDTDTWLLTREQYPGKEDQYHRRTGGRCMLLILNSHGDSCEGYGAHV
jgi:beta-glucosidase